MPRTKEQYAEMRDTSNQKIRSAAIRLFVEKGFAATSIDEIAEAANLSKGMVYRHYKSKDELFVSLVNGANKRLQQMIQGLEQADNPKVAMEAMIAQIYTDFIESEDFINLMLLLTQGLMNCSSAENSMVRIEFLSIEAAADLIQRGQKMNVFGQGDPMEMSIYAFSSVQGLVMMKRTLGNHFKIPDKEMLTAFLYRGLNNE